MVSTIKLYFSRQIANHWIRPAIQPAGETPSTLTISSSVTCLLQCLLLLKLRKHYTTIYLLSFLNRLSKCPLKRAVPLLEEKESVQNLSHQNILTGYPHLKAHWNSCGVQDSSLQVSMGLCAVSNLCYCSWDEEARGPAAWAGSWLPALPAAPHSPCSGT